MGRFILIHEKAIFEHVASNPARWSSFLLTRDLHRPISASTLQHLTLKMLHIIAEYKWQ